MTTELEFTGERFVPGVAGEIVYEHVHRYAFARTFVSGKRVLDCACGEGYGSALLASVASSVTGVDIDAPTIAHARERYAAVGNLAFVDASAASLPLADASVDVIVSFETIEHLPTVLQPQMLAEFARVLAANGVLVLSAPNRVEYSEKRGFVNPFHAHEHDRAELDALIAAHFPARAYFRQRMWMGSTIWSERSGNRSFAAHVGDAQSVDPAPLPEAMYFVVVAAKDATSLPGNDTAVSMYADEGETELARSYAAMQEVIRLDALLGEANGALDKQTAHVEHLEKLVAYRDGLIAERDTQLEVQGLRMMQFERQEAERDERDTTLRGELGAAHASAAAARVSAAEAQAARDDTRRELADSHAKLDESQAVIAAQERIIDYRQSWRWWWMLPWRRLRGGWQRMRDA